MKFSVLEAGCLEDAFRLLQRHDFDLLILELDIMMNVRKSASESALSEVGGLEVLEVLRSAEAYIPAIVVSGLRKSVYELAAIRTGADAFLPKPVDLSLLTAHVRAKLKLRQVILQSMAGQGTAHSYPGISAELIQAGDLLIDTKHRLVSVQNSEYLNLSATELRLLAIMGSNPGRVFRKHELLEEIWGVDSRCGYGAVESVVKRIRKKIEPKPGRPKYILASRGLGYRLAA